MTVPEPRFGDVWRYASAIGPPDHVYMYLGPASSGITVMRDFVALEYSATTVALFWDGHPWAKWSLVSKGELG
jgi:hypothetical protein